MKTLQSGCRPVCWQSCSEQQQARQQSGPIIHILTTARHDHTFTDPQSLFTSCCDGTARALHMRSHIIRQAECVAAVRPRHALTERRAGS